VTTSDGSAVVFDVDEHPRRGSSLEKLASLQGIHPEIPGFSVTAGNASGINDAAAAVVVTSDRFVAERALKPLATVRSWANIGGAPFDTGLAQTVAIPKALRKAGLTVADVDQWEINEAFAVVPAAA
jgi:acetyl-CoA acetyltransferase